MSFHTDGGKRLPPVLVRRLRRVLERMEKDDPAEAVLDDIFVLWRAFEGGWPSTWPAGEAARAQRAVEQTIKHWGLANLPACRRWIESLRHVDNFAEPEFKEWFNVAGSHISDLIDTLERLRHRARTPLNWQGEDSRDLSGLVYQLRCAIVHPSLNTTTASRFAILPALRDALVELTTAFAAVECGLTLEAARSAVKGVDL